MRTRIITLLSTIVLMLGILSMAQPAAAAPAEPYAVSACQIFGNFEFCYQTRGVIQRNESASGNTTYSSNGRRCYQATVRNELVNEGCASFHVTLHRQDGETQVYHTRQHTTSTFVYLGTTYTCTSSHNVVLANGEVRHEDHQLECNPPFPF